MSASATQDGHNNNLTCNARTVEKISSRIFGQSPGGQSETFLSVLQLTSLHLIYRRVFVDRDCFAYEVIAIREDRLTMMHHDFSMEEADDVIAHLVT